MTRTATRHASSVAASTASEPLNSEIPITKQGGAACLRVKNRYGLFDGHFLLFTHSGFLTFCAASCASFWVSGAGCGRLRLRHDLFAKNFDFLHVLRLKT